MNYERGIFDWQTTANVLRIGTEAAGTGTVRNIAFVGGNVGIGTTAPTQKLDIYQGNIQLSNNQGMYSRLTSGVSVLVIAYDSSNNLIFGANAELKLNGQVTISPPGTVNIQPGSNITYITGNVGIGTATPTALLTLAASTTTRAAMNFINGAAPTTPNNGDVWFDGTNFKAQIGGVTKTFTLV